MQEVGLALLGRAEMLGGQRGAPSRPCPQLLSQSCFSGPSRAWMLSLDPLGLEASRAQQASPSVSPRTGVWRKALLQWPPPQRPTLPPEAPLVLSHAPGMPISCLVPRSPRRPEEYWNVPCLRSEPEFDLSWVEMRGKCQEQLAHLLHFQTWRLPGLGFQTKLALAWTSAVPATRHIWVRLGS